ncbi:TetR/AcrR family transcriptional regulator C-terminal domain-containing protein [Nocardiopsis sp. CNT-189]|uniref:TetR/AcrR family transcriptional regulator n=1 Tax=Nocardiopsis oceanisediminis TaxID=2816862 RepID=UPI003B319BEE
MPRPRSLDRDAITGAALSVLERSGTGALSMRSVAAELGVSAMALYRYAEGREQLEVWIVDRLLGAVDPAPPAGGDWTERVALLMDRLRAAAAEHPAAVPLLLSHRHAAPASLRWIEAVLEVLTEAGFTGERRALAQRALVAHLLGALQLEHLGPLDGAGTAEMAGLPGAEFPRTAETARAARRITADEEFHHGLSALLRGLRDA